MNVCKKKDPVATLRMVDVLVTQHSKWTARRIRRALFGQSLVDFNADPWKGATDQTEAPKKKPHKKQSRLEKAFSQFESQSSQATEVQSSQEAIPATSLADENATNFQEFSTFQQQPAQFFQHPHFPNEHISQEQIFPESFQDPHFQHSFQDPHFHNAQYNFPSKPISTQEQMFSTSVPGIRM